MSDQIYSGKNGSPPASPANRKQLQVQIDDSQMNGKQSTGKQRPKSAYPSSSPSNQLYRSQSDNNMGNAFQSGSKNRPKSASGNNIDSGYHSPSHNSLHNLPPKEKEKQLSNLVRRIRQKSAKGSKETWSAARLSELLEGST
jgi:hypothetical protein